LFGPLLILEPFPPEAGISPDARLVQSPLCSFWKEASGVLMIGVVLLVPLEAASFTVSPVLPLLFKFVFVPFAAVVGIVTLGEGGGALKIFGCC